MKPALKQLLVVPRTGGLILGLSVLVLGFARPGTAALLTLGDLIVYRVGDGSAALANTATAVFLDEYTPAGTLVQSIALPTSGAGALTAVGNATTEGIISRAQNGTALIFTGYRADVGSANPSAAAPGTVNRIVATLSLAGTVDATTALTDPTGTIRSATSVDGTSSFYVSASTGVRYDASPFTASTSTLIDSRNSRQVNLSGNSLLAANGSTSTAAKVQTYGTLPTGTTVPAPVVSLNTSDAVNGFALFDLDPSVAGDDTLYALSTVANQLLKYSFDGTSWLANGSIGASGAQNIAGMASGGTVDLFLTSGSTLFSATDSSGFNATIAGSLTPLATAGANAAFRGIGLFQVPEPSGYWLLATGGLVLLAIARFRSVR